MKRPRSDGQAEAVARARRWRDRRDELRLRTAQLAELAGISEPRMVAIICARMVPSDPEAMVLDIVLAP